MSHKILIADDSHTMRHLVRFALEGEGHTVVDAEDGEAALEELARHSDVSMVITDLRMPRLDGVGVVRAVRAMAGHRSTPVIVLTTESSMEWKEQMRAAGASAWITKPFASEQLVALVSRFLA